jgi:hypothetical protein
MPRSTPPSTRARPTRPSPSARSHTKQEPRLQCLPRTLGLESPDTQFPFDSVLPAQRSCCLMARLQTGGRFEGSLWIGLFAALFAQHATSASARSFEIWVPPAGCGVDPVEIPRMGIGTGEILHRNPALSAKLSVHCPLTLHFGTDSAGNTWGTLAEEVGSTGPLGKAQVYVKDMNTGNGAGCPGGGASAVRWMPKSSSTMPLT